MTRNGGSHGRPGLGRPTCSTARASCIVPKADGERRPRTTCSSAVLEAGAEEVNDLGETFEVVSEATDLRRRPHRAAGRRHRLRLRRGIVRAHHAGRSWTRTAPRKMFRLIDALEDRDDVQNVSANFDVSDEIMERSTPEPRAGGA